MTNYSEYKANLPPLRKIFQEMLEFRSENGVAKTLAKATEIAELPYMGEEASKRCREDVRHLIAACNFSAAQCRKELKGRK